MDELAKQIEELNKNLKALIERLPPMGSLAGGWHVYHHHSYPPPQATLSYPQYPNFNQHFW